MYNEKYTNEILKGRYTAWKDGYKKLEDLKLETGLCIRHQAAPEDITENMTKVIIRNYDGDTSCMWAKDVNHKGDLYSDMYSSDRPIEVKAFTSNGPVSFGGTKKFGVLYFLDMRSWMEDEIILWRVNLTDESPVVEGVKVNKNETHKDQSDNKRRPRLGWDLLYPQIKDHCVMVYKGGFEAIFSPPTSD